MPSNTVDLSAFQGFLAARRRRRALQRRPLPRRDRRPRASSSTSSTGWRCKFVGIGMVRERLLAIVDRFDDFVHARADLRPRPLRHLQPGQGAAELELRPDPRSASASASSTSPSVFLQGPKDGMQLHWDGNNTKVSERNRSAAFGTGATPPILDRASLAAHGGLARHRRAAALHRRLPRPVRPRPRRRGRAGLRPRLRRLPRRLGPRLHRRVRRQGHADRRDRHRPRPARQLHPRPRGQPERALRRVRRRALPDLPQDRRLRQRAARRPLAARALPAQRLGPDAGGAARRRPPSARGAFLRGYDVYDPRAMGFVSDPARIDPAVAAAALLLRHHAPTPPPTARPARRR